MLHVIQSFEADLPENAGLIRNMHELRARAFHDRRGWRVVVENGEEKDAFDQMDPLYVLVSNGVGEVAASLRVLPTTGPYMMADVFPEVIGEQGVIRHPLIWEVSRLCVDTQVTRDFGGDGINVVTRMLLAGLFRTARGAGITNLIGVYDVYVERILKRAGCDFERLGPVVQYDRGLRTTSGLFDVTEATIAKLERSLVRGGNPAQVAAVAAMSGTDQRVMQR